MVLDRVVEVRSRTDLIARIFRMNLRSWGSRRAARPFASRLVELERGLIGLERSDRQGEIVQRLRQLAVRLAVPSTALP